MVELLNNIFDGAIFTLIMSGIAQGAALLAMAYTYMKAVDPEICKLVDYIKSQFVVDHAFQI